MRLWQSRSYIDHTTGAASMFGRRDKDDVAGDPVAEIVPPGVGPYDAVNAPTEDGIQRFDLGSLLLPALPDLELRMQASEDGQIGAVIIATADSALQLGVFAAPRTEGIWDEVRTEVAASVVADGGETKEVEGEFGTELLAEVSTPEGRAGLRFIGIDGPRWFLRGLFQGRAVTEADAAKPLLDALRHVIVVRDNQARPVREPLPLRLPKDVAEQAQRQAQA
jgi:hypothetical protein